MTQVNSSRDGLSSHLTHSAEKFHLTKLDVNIETLKLGTSWHKSHHELTFLLSIQGFVCSKHLNESIFILLLSHHFHLFISYSKNG